ncbi:hypothetical protein L5D93_23320 [Paenibacillus thiaminolyticus]|nr:hypothetical protein [Paenibacillus thiaminolyticus]
MSLCILANNPGNYVVLASDGRVTRNNDIVRDDFKKLTKINEYVSIFTSGIVMCSEDLRNSIMLQAKGKNIEEIALIASKESLRIHRQFLNDYPDYFKDNDSAAMATLIAYFDVDKNESGYIKLCKSDDYSPHKVTTSTVQTSGYMQDIAKDYFLKNYRKDNNPCITMHSVLKYINEIDKSVGGTMTLHVISRNGTDTYQAVI